MNASACHDLIDVIQLLLSWIATTSFLFAIVDFDERRLSTEEAERAWPTATKRAALVMFGPIALPLHFLRTRRSLKGIALAIASLAALLAFDAALGFAFDFVFPE